jgi:uncharacterized membrane protein
MRLTGRRLQSLEDHAKKVAQHVARRTHITRNVPQESAASPVSALRTRGAFGGSRTFVGLFAATMLAWVALNALLLLTRGTTFDPYRDILLNLILSTVAAIQAPINLMSQNRQCEKDHVAAEHDYGW